MPQRVRLLEGGIKGCLKMASFTRSFPKRAPGGANKLRHMLSIVKYFICVAEPGMWTNSRLAYKEDALIGRDKRANYD